MVITQENIITHIYDVYEKLKRKYNYNIIKEIPQIIRGIEEQPTKTYIQDEANKLQQINNILYQRYGDSDEVILFQARINQLRNIYDVPDISELKYTHDDGDYAQ